MRTLVASRFDGFEKLALNTANPLGWPFAPIRFGPFGIGYAFRIGLTPSGAACRACNDGTSTPLVCGRSRRSPSYDKKKKVEFFPLNQGWRPPSPNRGKRIGPPSTKPKSLCRVAGFASRRKLLNQSLASKASLRKYSNALP